MSVESIGDAFALGWRVTVRCRYGRSDGPRSQSSRECNYRKELDMETLVWTRGRAFPLSRLESRLRWLRLAQCGGVVSAAEQRRRRLARRVSGDQVARIAGLAMKRKQSVDFTGYWQRHLPNIEAPN